MKNYNRLILYQKLLYSRQKKRTFFLFSRISQSIHFFCGKKLAYLI